MIWAMVLAAGESTRMGSPKLLLPFGKKTMIETVVHNIINSKVNNTLVILGADTKEIEEKIKRFPLSISVNPHFEQGMLSSVQWGFQQLPEDARAVLVALGDQPNISPTVADKIIDAFNTSKKRIILPVFNRNRGHPVLIDMKYRDEVNALSPDVGLRGLVYSHEEDILEIEVEASNILRDVDDIEDYKNELKRKE